MEKMKKTGGEDTFQKGNEDLKTHRSVTMVPGIQGAAGRSTTVVSQSSGCSWVMQRVRGENRNPRKDPGAEGRMRVPGFNLCEVNVGSILDQKTF